MAQISGSLIKDGKDGKEAFFISDTEPTEKTIDMLWQDSSSTPQVIKRWDGTTWKVWGIYAENLNVDNLSAISANLGEVTAGSYESWETREGASATYKNGIFFKNGVLMTLAIENPTNANPYVRGTINASGQIRFYQGQLPKTITDNTSKMFNKDGSNTFFYNSSFEAGYIDSYVYTNGTKQLSYYANEHLFLGDMVVQGNLKVTGSLPRKILTVTKGDSALTTGGFTAVKGTTVNNTDNILFINSSGDIEAAEDCLLKITCSFKLSANTTRAFAVIRSNRDTTNNTFIEVTETKIGDVNIAAANQNNLSGSAVMRLPKGKSMTMAVWVATGVRLTNGLVVVEVL